MDGIFALINQNKTKQLDINNNKYLSKSIFKDRYANKPTY